MTSTTSPRTSHSRSRQLDEHRRALKIALPEPHLRLAQDEEWIVAEVDGEWRQIGMHDYAALYAVPGLYERVVYDALGCRSPQRVRDLLGRALGCASVEPGSLRVLDLGAGNGYVAAELARLGVRRFVGADIIPEAAEAAERDRPGLYGEYVVGDLTALPERDRQRLERHAFNGLTCVAALGFGDIPPEAFVRACALLQPGAWLAFTIKSDFLSARDRTGFARLIGELLESGVLERVDEERFVHRLGTDGEPLHYNAFICRKRGEVPDLRTHA